MSCDVFVGVLVALLLCHLAECAHAPSEEVGNNALARTKRASGLEWLAGITGERGYAVEGVGPVCVAHMHKYWQGLDEQTMWASQIYDANGRYSSGYMFGNDFWLGSMMLCQEVRPPEFNVTFRVAKLRVTLTQNMTSQIRIIYMGICQPETCSSNDSYLMLTKWTSAKASSENNNNSIEVMHVRKVPGNYTVLTDSTFYVVCCTLTMATVLVITATIYDKFVIIKHGAQKNIIENKKGNATCIDNNMNEDGYQLEKQPSASANNSAHNLSDKKCDEDKVSAQCAAASEYLLAFSAIKNGKQILSLKSQGNGALTTIHGLRFFSLTWVILVHTYLQFFAIGGNKMVRLVTERSFMFRTIGNATFSVDTFFFISGVLITYLYNTTAIPSRFTKTLIEFTSSLFYRLIRLSPVYMLVMGMVRLSMSYVQNNSVFEPNILDNYNCQNYWWRNLLFINNFYPRTEMCMVWSWYLAADTQFFVISSFILIISKRRLKLAGCILGTILAVAWGTTAFVAYTNQFQAKLSEPFALFDELYDKPWTRIGPYIVGMITGYIIKNTDRTLSMSKLVLIAGWGTSVAIVLSVVYGLGTGLDVPLSAAYVSLAHTAWGLGLSWILLACHTGHGGIINRLLSSPVLFPLSRLTFCAYLVHPLIMVLTSYVMDGSFHIHNGIIVIIFLGNTVASFLLSFILSLGFEAPIVKLLKLIFR